MPRTVTTPVGRIVQGSVFEPSLTDQQGNPRVFRSGPKMGQPSPQYFIAVAFSKTDPAWPAFHAALDAEAREAWPHLFPGGAACVLPSFAWKIVDGDGVDTSGKSNAGKDGFAGCWVVRFSSGFAPKAVKLENGSYRDVGPDELKRGHYVRISTTISGNSQPTKPGIYVNLDAVCWEAYGAEIVGGPDVQERFGAAPVALPPGASVTPPASAAPMPASAAPMPATPPLGAPAAPVASPPAYTGYMPGAAPVTPPPAPPAPPPRPARVMLPAAGPTPYETYVAAGWTDEQLVAHGYMAA